MYIFEKYIRKIILSLVVLSLFNSLSFGYDSSKLSEIDNLRAILAYSNVASSDYIKTKQKLSKLINAAKMDYSPEARLNDVARLIKECKFDSAIYEIKELILLNYEISKCYEYYGDIYLRLNKDSSRIASCYKNAINADNYNISAMLKLAKLYLKEERLIMGIQTLRDIVLQTENLEVLNEIEYIALNKIAPKSKYDANNVYEMLGWIYQKQGDIEQSLKVYKKAIQLNPKDIFLKYYLADLYMLCNRTSEALVIYNEILNENKYDSQIRISKAKILTSDGRLSDASEEYIKILKDYPNSAYAKYGIFKIYQGKLQPDKILAKINQDENFVADKQNCLDFAKFLNNIGDEQGAKMYYDFALSFDKKEEVIATLPPAKENKPNLKENDNLNKGTKNKTIQNKEAKSIKKENTNLQVEAPTLKQEQNYNDIPFERKNIDTKQKEVQKQAEQIKKNVEKPAENPKTTPSVKPQEKQQVKKEEKKQPQVKKQEVKKENQKSQQQLQQEAIAKERKAAIAKNSKNYHEQKKILDKYMAINPKDAYCYLAIANTYRQMGEFTNSTIYYNEAIKLDAANPDIYFNLALSYLEMDKLELSRQNLVKAYNLDSDNLQAMNMLSFVDQKIITRILNSAYEKFEKHEYISAFELLDNGIKKYPDNSQLYYYRALVYDAMNRNAAAIIDLQKALELNSGYFMAYYQLGKIYEKVKDERSALVAYEKFLSTEPSEKDLINEVQKKVIDLGNKYY